MTAFWKDAHDEGGLAWDDTNNNRAFLSQTICATLNGASIYIESLRNPDKYITEKGAAAEERHPARALCRRDPAGQFAMHTYQSHMLIEVLEEPEGREGLPDVGAHDGELRAVVHLAEGLCHAADRVVGEPQAVGRGSGDDARSRSPASSARRPAIAGPAGKKAAEALTKYIITDMYAKAVQGMSAEDAVKWAESELKKIYV